MVPQKKKHTIGLVHALAGIRYALHTQRNFVYQLLFALIVFLLATLFNVNTSEWLFLIASVFFVLTVELLNSAIELWVDSGVLETNIYAKRVKDIAAAAVLVSVIGSIFVGMIVFAPRFLTIYASLS